jgi:hypothetical protein
MQKIELVFRTVGERTSEIALDLAIKNIQPQRVHIIENVKPFSLAVQQMLKIDYDCYFVVFMDADCLIMENMALFLQENTVPYIDCYVLDKFRGYVHCGVHIVRIDVVQAMKNVEVPKGDRKYVLRPESRIRDLAMQQLNLAKVFRRFAIFHDFCQFYRDIFSKYALRELRSRTDYHQAKLNVYQEDWNRQAPDDLDFQVAKYAIAYTRENFQWNASSQETEKFIAALPSIASWELNKKNILEKESFTLQEAEALLERFPINNQRNGNKTKIFGIGFSQTGTQSLAHALTLLGFNVIYSPDDEVTLKELMAGNYNLSILKDFDGITDITVAPFYTQLDKLFPNSKFILTVRDKKSWLRSLAARWSVDSVLDDSLSSNETNMQRRRLLRVATYGSYTFDEKRFAYAYDLHYEKVIEYFKNRLESLLVFNIYAGEGWEKLCSFLNQPILNQSFPFRKTRTPDPRLLEEVGDLDSKFHLNPIQKTIKYID